MSDSRFLPIHVGDTVEVLRPDGVLDIYTLASNDPETSQFVDSAGNVQRPNLQWDGRYERITIRPPIARAFDRDAPGSRHLAVDGLTVAFHLPGGASVEYTAPKSWPDGAVFLSGNGTWVRDVLKDEFQSVSLLNKAC